ncbi:response regulator [Fulvivirga ulvae]|uniref:response regulator n=1 Tax=Fulvivirga ulvae TaxID=2904245 RepID=UPI001F394138|nr:response regulator [Fulvivirga ulvae]UII34397.1 response regulator [Fulvivirga ulvae]
MMTDSKKRIIYLEDDEFTRLMVQAQFENAGFSVEAFSSYSDLIEAMKEKQYDIVVTDLNVDGHEPQQLIRSIKSINAIPVVVLSASAVEVSGANLSLEKPLKNEDIKEVEGLLVKTEDRINLSKVYKFACGDQELLVSYVNTFIDNYEKDLLLLKSEIDSADIRVIKNLAHKMLSSVSYYDQDSLNKLLQKLELSASGMSKRQITDHFQQIEYYSDKLLNGIRKQVKDTTPPTHTS